MVIAVTYKDGEVFQHFGHTEAFKLYNVKDGEVIYSEVFGTEGFGHGTLATFLKGRNVDVLICGGIGGGARAALAAQGIELFPGASGNADEQVANYIAGALKYDPDTMCSHHGEGHTCGDHHHEEGHSCGGNCHK